MPGWPEDEAGLRAWLARPASEVAPELLGWRLSHATDEGTVKGVRVFDLSFTWNDQSPVLGLNPPYSFALNRTHKMTHEIFGQAPGSRVSWASDIMYFSG